MRRQSSPVRFPEHLGHLFMHHNTSYLASELIFSEQVIDRDTEYAGEAFERFGVRLILSALPPAYSAATYFEHLCEVGLF